MDYYDKIVSILDIPYFKNLNSIGIDEVHYNEIFDRVYKEPVTIEIDYESNTKDIFNKKGLLLYYETSNGYWVRREYNENGKTLYYVNSEGLWIKQEFDDNGGIIYRETSSDGILLDNRNK